MPRSQTPPPPLAPRSTLPLAPRSALPLLLLLILLPAFPCKALTPTPAALSAFNTYTAALEHRLAAQRLARAGFVALIANNSEAARLRSGELILEQLSPPPQSRPPLPGALLHHWRGTAFVPGASAADFDNLLRNISGYPRIFAPQVLRAVTLAGTGDHLQLGMRVEQRHGLTVTLDTTYSTAFGQLDPQHRWSTSLSTAVTEIDNPGTPRERPLTPGKAHGFLWRQNTYWSYEERDGGLYLQLESVSLTRDVPAGLNWIAGPYLASIPRDSLAFTLRSASKALSRNSTQLN